MHAVATDKKDSHDSTELLAVTSSSAALGGPSSNSQSGNPSLPDDDVLPKYTERAFESAYFPPGGEEPPPEFTPFDAEYFISGGEIVSHDQHLNQDGECSHGSQL